MKRVVSLLFVLFVVLLNTSCSEEDNTNELNQSTNIMGTENCPIISSQEELDALFFTNANIPLTELDDISGIDSPITKADDANFLTAESYTRKYTFMKEQKATFSTEYAEIIGVLPGVIYFVRIDKYEIDIKTGGKQLFKRTSPNCGAKPLVDKYGNESSDFKTLGYRVVREGNPTTLSTHLYYISGTFGGSATRKWYPISPDLLKWDYILF